jgi:pilus assembly protein FimV
VVKQYTENQYDDDLTVGTDDYDDSYYTGSVDLFEFSNDEESPISRLKSLILSIDWEITDEVLMEFNEELVDLRDIWAGEKIYLVYVQALEKISKYIYQKKADSHPSAIKLLLTLYHNLEKIVSSLDLTEEQKKDILLEDVKRFENLKLHISKQSQTVDAAEPDQQTVKIITENTGSDSDLLNLKAIVLGIDWEITDQDLNELRQEVVRLEGKFAESRPRLILLQGIGTLGAYIKLKKSNAHADAFKILHLFYESLEKIVTAPMSMEEEKAILFPAVEKFNSFKTLLGPTIAPEAISRDEEEEEEEDLDDSRNSPTIAPAFSDLPEDEIKGFQAEEEAKALGLDSSGNVDNHVESFFMESSLENQDEPVLADVDGTDNTEKVEMALQGADVEGDDEEDRTSPESDAFAPALSSVIEEKTENELARDEEQVVVEESLGLSAAEFSDNVIDFDFTDENEETSGIDFSKLDRDIVLQGVDVETEADDESDEDALPMMEGELAPALAENDEISIFNAEIFENSTESELIDDDIVGTLGGFFDEEIASHLSFAPSAKDEGSDVASIVVESEDEEETDLSDDSLSSFDSGNISIEDQDFTPLATESVSFPGEEPDFSSDENVEITQSETGHEDEGEGIAFLSALEQEESPELLFADSALEQDVEDPVEDNVVLEEFNSHTLAEEADEETSTDIDEQLDSFFDLDEGFGESEDDNPLSFLAEETAEDIVPSIPDYSEEDEVVFELAEDEEEFNGNLGLIPEIDKSEDAYRSLQTCVDSLGIELDDKVILGLIGEIELLHQNLADKPLERTFLHLLSTITRHIDQNRYDSSSDAFVLLQSVSGTLTELQEDELYRNQEMLLSETSKVLQWQEKILADQVARDEAELTMGYPLPGDPEGEIGDFDDLLQSYGEDQILDTDVIYDNSFEQSGIEDPTRADEGQEKLYAQEDTIVLNDDLKDEISTLRQTLQDEIVQLRNELKGN